MTIEAGFKLLSGSTTSSLSETLCARSSQGARPATVRNAPPRGGLYRFVILCPIEAVEHRAGLGEFLHRTNTSLPSGLLSRR